MKVTRTEGLVVWFLPLLTASCVLFDSGPPIGDRLPEVQCEDLQSQRRSTSEIETPCILFFYNPSCRPCKNVLAGLHPYFEQAKGPLPSLYLLVKGDWKNGLTTSQSKGFPVLAISHQAWHSVFQINRTPVLLFYQTQRKLLQKQVGWRPAFIQKRILDRFVAENRRTAVQSSSNDCNSVQEHSHDTNSLR